MNPKLLPDILYQAPCRGPAPTAMSTLAEDRFIDANDAFLCLTGYNREELLEHTSLELGIWADARERVKAMQMLRERGKITCLEASFYDRCGNAYPGLFSAELFELGGKKYILSVTQISPRHKRAKDMLQEKEREIQELRQSECKYRCLVENTNSAIFSMNTRGYFTYISPAVERMSSYKVDEIVGQHFSRFILPEDIPQVMSRLEKATEDSIECRIVNKNQSIGYMRASVRLSQEGEPMTWTGVVIDISDLKQTKEALRYQVEFESLISMLSRNFINISSQEFEGAIRAGLRKIGEFVGVDRSYLIPFNGSLSDTIHEWRQEGIESLVGLGNMFAESFPWWWEKLKRFEEIVTRVDDLPPEAANEKYLLKSQSIKSIMAVPMSYGRVLRGFLGLDSLREEKNWAEEHISLLRIAAEIFSSALHRKHNEEQLKYLGFHDALTGLYNRAYFDQEIQRLEWNRDYPFTVISTDLDGLKQINDSLGHAKGDEMLKAYSQVLRATFRATDIVARVGGDEFAVLLPGTDSITAQDLCLRLQQTVSTHNQLCRDFLLSASFGCATADDRSLSVEEVLVLADKNMYLDKVQHAKTCNI